MLRSHEIARLAGFMFGDGWVSYNRAGEYYEAGFQQAVHNEAVYKLYKTLLLRAHNGYYRESRRNGKLELKLYGKRIYHMVRRFKEKPLRYLSIEPLAFTAGLVDAEGSVSESEVTIYNSNLKVLESIQLVLACHNISCKVKPHRNRYFRLRVRGCNNVLRFLALIPTIKKPCPQGLSVLPRRLPGQTP